MSTIDEIKPALMDRCTPSKLDLDVFRALGPVAEANLVHLPLVCFDMLVITIKLKQQMS